MPVSLESVSAKPPPSSSRSEAVLVAGVNWLGDSVMSMPALQAYRRIHPQTRLVMLVKPPLAGLWSLHQAIDEVWTLPDNLGGMLLTARRAASERFRCAFVLPHSFRSALAPFLARIPDRVGLPGHGRDWMLTRIEQPPCRPALEHQCHEYRALFGVTDLPLETPRLNLSGQLSDAALQRLNGLESPRVALLPGAAYGPAKRWPAEYFITLGGMLKSALHCGIVVLGSGSERDLCARVTAGIGSGAVDFAGRTTLPEFAALLAHCALVVANDSGGMHLATAAGVPVLAIFGITDPQKTGPLGERVRILQDSVRRSRDIERNSEEAVLALRRIKPEQALAAARALLHGGGGMVQDPVEQRKKYRDK